MDTSGKSAVKFLMKNILAKPADLKFLYVKKKKNFFKEQHQRFEDFFSLMSRFCSQEIVWVLSTSFSAKPNPRVHVLIGAKLITVICFLVSLLWWLMGMIKIRSVAKPAAASKAAGQCGSATRLKE